jgi:hypothetical protein
MRSRGFRRYALRFVTPALRPGRVSGIALDPQFAPAGSIELLLPPQVLELDGASGLDRPGGAAPARAGCGAAFEAACSPVRSLAPAPEAELGTEPFEPLPCPAVLRCMPLGRPGVRSRPLMAAGSRVRSAGLLAPAHAVTDGRRRIGLLADPAVIDRSLRFGRMPHARRGIDLASLGDGDRLDYLREAEVLRGVPPERGELLAVFRKVPVELVRRIRFLAESGLLLYTITRAPGLQRTRLHDLAAVRNRDSGGVHLVAHRTRYRTAFLA